MAKIHVLPPHEAQKIAAGEVVERPANVIKELIENALDAGATEITLHIEDGGKQLIRIIDNGCGMSPEDARLCIEHHATSKLTTIHDLASTRTFGFRGEALSSIAAVSTMNLITKEEIASAATLLEIHEGTITQEKLVAANTGTDLSIHHLFFNVPARQKFLKTKETEWRAIVHLVQALALAHEAVTFKLSHDGRQIINAPGATSMSQRMGQLFEPALAHNSLTFSGSQERMELAVTGALSNPTYARFDRSQIYVFVNKRWVKNHKLVQAFIKGYQQMLQPGRYPAGCLFISLDPQYVDINVHPRKEEVQFLHPRIIEELIEESVRAGLEKTHSSAHAVRTEKVPLAGRRSLLTQEPRGTDEENIAPAQANHGIAAQAHRANTIANSVDGSTSRPPIISLQERAIKDVGARATDPIASTQSDSTFTQAVQELFTAARVEKNDQELQTNFAPETAQQENYRIFGQLDHTYILIETETGLSLIDQHAAHERVVYERLRSRFETVTSVRLLFPQVITLAAEDCSLLEPHLDMLLSFGIEAQRMSETQIVISHTPLFLKNQSLEDTIKQAISALHEHDYLPKEELRKLIQERVHAQLSCTAAVKAGDELSYEGMIELVRDLFACPNKLTCPHGRPTKWELSLSDIEKKFKRDYR